MADRVGQQLGNYLIIRPLGEGGFAEVYLGQHIFLKTEAAIKVLQTQLSGHDIDEFVNEARTIANLIHPNIVRVLEFGMEGKTPFLVMDYAPNGTLRQRHPKGTRLNPDIVIPYVKQISTGLQYAHNQKLIHRDIKPENLLVGRHNEILLSDFGIALVAQSSRYQSTQDVVGTVAYMSPEQIQGKPRPASDQYSLGVVVYEWLSGDRPFRGSFTELCTQHMFAPPPPLRERVPTISPDIERVVNTALAKEPKERFATVQAFANALEQASQAPLFEKTVLPPPPELTATVLASASPPVQPLLTATTPAMPNTYTPPALITPSTPVIASSSQQPAAAGTSLSATRRISLVPLGLIAFAVSAFLLGASNAALFTSLSFTLRNEIFPDIVALVFAITGLVQIIAGIQELRRGNNFTATVFCSYGAFWISFGLPFMPLFSGEYLIYLTFNSFHGLYQGLGIFILSWTIFTVLMSIYALRGHRVFIALFASIFLSLLLYAIGLLQFNTSLIQASGWFVILSATLAIVMTGYIATHRSTLKPVSPGGVNSLPLGLSAFALTTFTISLTNAGFLTGSGIALGLFLFYGGLVQIIAGIQTLVQRSAFAATAFCANGSFWIILGCIFTYEFYTGDIFHSTSLNTIFGILFIGWTIANVIALILARKTSIALMLTLLAVSATLLSLAIGFLSSSGTGIFITISGWLGIITSALAWYVMLALLLTEAKKPLKLPMGVRS